MVNSSFPRHISHQAFQIHSNLANLSAESYVLGLPRDISPFPSSHEVISGFSGTMHLSLSEHMATIIMLQSNSKFILLMQVQIKLIGSRDLHHFHIWI